MTKQGHAQVDHQEGIEHILRLPRPLIGINRIEDEHKEKDKNIIAIMVNPGGTEDQFIVHVNEAVEKRAQVPGVCVDQTLYIIIYRQVIMDIQGDGKKIKQDGG